jgi:homoserine O-acetyltransferase/O-succinyltransferase
MEGFMMLRLALIAVFLSVGAPALAQTSWPNQREAEFVMKDFRFGSGEVLPELRMHYVTLGTPKRNAAGEIVNGVLLLHGTSGSSATWLMPALASGLFGTGQPLDAAEYFVILPDSVGSGRSSKPSDGLRGKFPHYRYRDAVLAQHRLVTEALGIRRLRLILGTSMGGMHTWMWGEMFPDAMDGLVPIASQPIGISGRNWIMRRIRIEAIRNDPDWKGGDYETNPTTYIYTLPVGAMTTESVVQIQEMAPTREAADKMYRALVEQARKGDANNQLYATEAVMDYDPSRDLELIKARLLAINFADDEVNPPELGVLDPAVRRIRHGRHVVVPASRETHGHYSYMRPALWTSHLVEFMKGLPPQ